MDWYFIRLNTQKIFYLLKVINTALALSAWSYGLETDCVTKFFQVA